MQIRRRAAGTPSRPRVAVYRSLNPMYAQVIDDLAGKTVIDTRGMRFG